MTWDDLRRSRNSATSPPSSSTSRAAPNGSSTTRPSTSRSSTRNSRSLRLSGVRGAAMCSLVDTLALARDAFPGKRNNLDALCERFGVDARASHAARRAARRGALAEVYLAMTRGQESLTIDLAVAPRARVPYAAIGAARYAPRADRPSADRRGDGCARGLPRQRSTGIARPLPVACAWPHECAARDRRS